MIPTSWKTKFIPWILTGMVCVTAGPASAHDVFVHRSLTREVLSDLGWSDETIDRVVTYNVGTDIGRLPSHSRVALQLIFPDAVAETSEIRRVAATAPFNPATTKGFHFNSLYSFDAITDYWENLDRWVSNQCEYIASTPADSERYYQVLGITLHAVQDFYAHANWVGILDIYTESSLEPGEFPVWEELVADESGWLDKHPGFPADEAINRLKASNAFMSQDEGLGGLQTGRIRGEHIAGDVEPWSHRHERGEAKAVVHDLTRRSTRLWVEQIDRNIAEARLRNRAELQTD